MNENVFNALKKTFTQDCMFTTQGLRKKQHSMTPAHRKGITPTHRKGTFILNTDVGTKNRARQLTFSLATQKAFILSMACLGRPSTDGKFPFVPALLPSVRVKGRLFVSLLNV